MGAHPFIKTSSRWTLLLIQRFDGFLDGFGSIFSGVCALVPAKYLFT